MAAVRDAVEKARSVDDTLLARMRAIAYGSYSSCDTQDSSCSRGLPVVPDPTWSIQEVSLWWASLSQLQRSRLISSHPDAVGNLDGVPTWARDRANRLMLERLIAKAQRDIDAIKALRATGKPYPVHQPLAVIEKQLAELEAVKSLLVGSTSSAPYSLLTLDPKGVRLKAAVGIGDVHTAEHVAVLVPGMGTNVRDSLEYYTGAAQRLRVTTPVDVDEVAVVAWLGYEAPQSLETPDFSVVSTDKATRGAESLTPFLEGIHNSRIHNGSTDPHLTLLGHSYGSTTSARAMTQIVPKVVDDFVMFGSPGGSANSADEYGVVPGHAYVSGVPTGDLVQGIGPDWAFGTNPMRMPDITHITGDATGSPSYDPHSRGFANHSTYLDPGTETLRQIAKIVGGGR
ncbi:alpha/beta hydrolase [Schaalia vaccimaxillae]|uniref:alpha/beta hydrolase n=1 Tax=Schaalia vaccimaxillae TaxID=183916 RepID=UPI0003B65F91|nr:alpha/beta hydrolase [Schaalia vaccimaxillae]